MYKTLSTKSVTKKGKDGNLIEINGKEKKTNRHYVTQLHYKKLTYGPSPFSKLSLIKE
jgi:hypothetical protein